MLAWLSGTLVVVLLDQLTKLWVLSVFDFGERVRVLPFFDLTLLYNTGAAFSLGAGGGGTRRWLFIAIAIGAALLILYWLYRHGHEWLLGLALACILAGALGNGLDRVVHGHVVDFLLFYWRDWYFPAFNLADIAITCGAGLLILDEVLRLRRQRTHSHGG